MKVIRAIYVNPREVEMVRRMISQAGNKRPAKLVEPLVYVREGRCVVTYKNSRAIDTYAWRGIFPGTGEHVRQKAEA